MKTPIPVIDITSTFKAVPYFSGYVGTYAADGSFVPEVGAYIYIYIDGFLVNPPSYSPETGTYNNSLAVISDSNGRWQTIYTVTDSHSTIYVNPGSVLTVRAKNKNKDLSDLSIPYVVQGMVTPTNLGVTGDFDKFRPPFDGEFIIRGNLSYWSSASNLKCKNQIFIYNDGYIIGEVQPNKIIGKDAVYPIVSSLVLQRLSLLVNNNVISIPLEDLFLYNRIIPYGIITSSNTFVFSSLKTNSSLLVYNNIRLIDGVDYTVSRTADNIVTITFLKEIESGDSLVIFEVDNSEVIYNSPLVSTTDPAIFSVPSIPNQDTFQVFQNGLSLQKDVDYSFIDSYHIQLAVIPSTNLDTFVADYQNITATTQFLFSAPVTKINSTTFTIAALATQANINVYKNGVLQVPITGESGKGSYTLTKGSTEYTITFLEGSIDTVAGDVLTVNYEIMPLSVTTLINFLNSTFEFQNNCLEASLENNQLVISSNNLLDLVIPPLSTEDLQVYRAFFGSSYTLNPGKDTDGEFLYFIRMDTGDWKYSNLDLTTRKPIPFNRGEHLSARAVHNDVVYKQ